MTLELPESADGVVLTGREADVLHREASLLKGHDLVLVRGPVLVTLGRVLLNDPVEHDDSAAALFPDHAPEVRSGGGQRSLGEDVGPSQALQSEEARIDIVGAGHTGERNPAVVIRIHVTVSASVQCLLTFSSS